MGRHDVCSLGQVCNVRAHDGFANPFFDVQKNERVFSSNIPTKLSSMRHTFTAVVVVSELAGCEQSNPILKLCIVRKCRPAILRNIFQPTMELMKFLDNSLV